MEFCAQAQNEFEFNIMQYKIPQGIDMQDRIFGPLTMIQFGIILFGGLISYLIFLKIPGRTGVYLALFFASVSVAVSFEYARRMMKAAIIFLTKPKARVWHKEGAQDIIIRETNLKKLNVKKDIKKHSKNEINELAKIVDTRGHGDSI